MQDFKRRGAIVDSPMGWRVDGANSFSSELVAYSDLHYPRRYEWDSGTRRWKVAAGCENLRWRDE